MSWEVEYTDEFGQWWQTLWESQQDAVAARVELLMEYGAQTTQQTPKCRRTRQLSVFNLTVSFDRPVQA